MKPYKTGLVLGKFCPLHRGHVYLIETALKNCEKTYVIIDNIMDHVFPLLKRKEWISKIFVNANVLILPTPLPQDPSETKSFWDLWKNAIQELVREKIDCVFASEPYGSRLSSELEAEFYPVDIQRNKIPVSATSIRKNIFKTWGFLPSVVQDDLKVSICVFGPESTGKTTLSRQLSSYFKCPLIPEYAEEVIRAKKGIIKQEDMRHITIEHNNRIKTLQIKKHPLIIVDTDAITTKLWSKELFSIIPDNIEEIIRSQQFDLYLLLDIDLEWQDDIHRYRPQGRKEFFKNCKKELELYQRPFSIIQGEGAIRFQNALAAIYSRFPYLFPNPCD